MHKICVNSSQKCKSVTWRRRASLPQKSRARPLALLTESERPNVLKTSSSSSSSTTTTSTRWGKMLEADQIHDEKVVSNVETMQSKADLEVSLSRARLRSLSISLSCALSLAPPPACVLSLSLSLSHTLFRSLSRSRARALSLSISLSVSLSLSLLLSRSQCLSVYLVVCLGRMG